MRKAKVRGAWVHSKRARPDRREDVRWVVVLRLRGRGRWHGSRTFARKDLADEFAAHLRAELAAGRVPDMRGPGPEPEERSVLAVLRDFEASEARGPSAAKRVRNVRLRLEEDPLGGVDVEQASRHDVQAFIDRMEADGLAASTCQQYIVPVRQAFDHAELGRPNPARDRRLRFPGRSQDEGGEPDPPTRSEFEAMLHAVRPKYRDVLVLLEGAGLRVSEAAELRWGDVDLARRRIRVSRVRTKGRTGGQRWVPMTDDVAAMLARRAPLEDREGPVFLGLTDNGIRHAMRTACRLAGIAHRHPHDLRDRFISLCLLSGLPVELVARVAGHRKKSMTLDTYSFVVIEEPRERLVHLRRVVSGLFGLTGEEAEEAVSPANQEAET